MTERFKEELVKVKPDGDRILWSIRVECGMDTRGAVIVTSKKAGSNAKLIEQRKPILTGKRLKSANPLYPLDLALSEANSRVLKRKSDGYINLNEGDL